MSIPASALKEDELFHYASLEPGAADELARRIASGDIDPNAGLEDLREDIRILESQADDNDEELDRLRNGAEEACTYIKRAMNHDEDEELPVSKLLQKALDCLE
jgi:DNA-binding ferritin-like protein